MFVFYFGIFANITPPVALAAFAGAGIAGGSPNKTGYQADETSQLPDFIVPFMFVFSHEMLMIDATVFNVLIITITSLIGVFLLSIMTEGYFLKDVAGWMRVLGGIAALLLIYPGLMMEFIGLIVFVFILVTNLKNSGRVSQEQSPKYSTK